MDVADGGAAIAVQTYKLFTAGQRNNCKSGVFVDGGPIKTVSNKYACLTVGKQNAIKLVLPLAGWQTHCKISCGCDDEAANAL